MSRYARKVITTGTNAWNAEANDNHLNTFDRPLPIIKHAGDLASLQSTYAAASYDQCLAICQYSSTAGDGLIFAVSDGSVWRPVSGWQLFQRVLYTAVSSGPYTVLSTDDFIVTSGAGSYAVNLPAVAGSNNGRKITVKHVGTGTITVTADGSDTIDGSATHAIGTQYAAFSYVSDGTSNWHII